MHETPALSRDATLKAIIVEEEEDDDGSGKHGSDSSTKD
jgi:hypothetical protein